MLLSDYPKDKILALNGCKVRDNTTQEIGVIRCESKSFLSLHFANLHKTEVTWHIYAHWTNPNIELILIVEGLEI